MAKLHSRKLDAGRKNEKETKSFPVHKIKKSKASKWLVFSSNSDKRWAEKCFLAYSPVWPVLFGVWCMSGLHLKVGDIGNMAVTCAIFSPNVIIPALYCPSHRPWFETYWFKFVLWVGVFTFVASYFWTEYFFDVLGMKYNFPHLKWNFDSILLGSGRQIVPVMMYVHAWYFFITYHTCSIICMRMVVTSPLLNRVLPTFILWPVVVVFTAWVFAWGEIFGTTLEAIQDQFTYKDMDWALKWGAILYSFYFIASFPIVYHLDEDLTKHKPWTLQRVVHTALAAGMIGFILLDLGVQFWITDWQQHDHRV